MKNLDSHETDSLSQMVFSADPISYFQYERVHHSQGAPTDQRALRALMLAVLEDGIACFQSCLFQPSHIHEKLSEEAERWMNSDDDRVFSFKNICEILGLDPERLRKRLLQWKARQVETRLEERKRLVPKKGKWLVKRRKAV